MENRFFLNKITMELNVIGYPKQGECIIFFIRTDDHVVYSGLVDSYRSTNATAISDILSEAEVEKLNIVLWTHPHDDHTKGLNEIIDNYCDKNTMFVATDIINPQDLTLYSKESQEIYNRLKAIHQDNSSKKMEIVYTKNYDTIEKMTFENISTGEKYLYEMKVFAPNSTLIAENICRDKDAKGNLYSLGILINFGHFNIVLAGDVEDVTFNRMKNFAITYPVDYIKIPHHASSTSTRILYLIDQNSTVMPSVAATTVFYANNLPDEDVLQRYKTCGIDNVLITNNLRDEKANLYPYGRIKTVFDIMELAEYPIETYLYGNAVKMN